MDAVDAVADLADLAGEALRVRRRIEARVERVAGHDLVDRRPRFLEEAARGGAVLPDLAELGPEDLDELRAVEVARDAPLLAANGERVTLAGREHEEGPVAVLRDGLDVAARRGEKEGAGEQSARDATARRICRLHRVHCNANRRRVRAPRRRGPSARPAIIPGG